MRVYRDRLCVVLIALALVGAPIVHAFAMMHMADAQPAMSEMPQSDDCGTCGMDAGKALGMCAAMCGSIGPAVLAADAFMPVHAGAAYFLVVAPSGVSRAPPPDRRPPNQ